MYTSSNTSCLARRYLFVSDNRSNEKRIPRISSNAKLCEMLFVFFNLLIVFNSVLVVAQENEPSKSLSLSLLLFLLFVVVVVVVFVVVCCLLFFVFYLFCYLCFVDITISIIIVYLLINLSKLGNSFFISSLIYSFKYLVYQTL